MPADARSEAREKLARLLPQIMEDGRVDDDERLALKRVFDLGVLSVADVKEIFGAYLAGLQAEILEDGLVTEEEQAKVRAAVKGLGIPRDLLTPVLRAIAEDRPLPRR